jgi:hypothetical protein
MSRSNRKRRRTSNIGRATSNVEGQMNEEANMAPITAGSGPLHA